MSDADPSDETLIARYARGDAEAFTVLYRRHELRAMLIDPRSQVEGCGDAHG